MSEAHIDQPPIDGPPTASEVAEGIRPVPIYQPGRVLTSALIPALKPNPYLFTVGMAHMHPMDVGQRVNVRVTSITLEGDNVIVLFTDGSTIIAARTSVILYYRSQAEVDKANSQVEITDRGPGRAMKPLPASPPMPTGDDVVTDPGEVDVPRPEADEETGTPEFGDLVRETQ